MSESNHLKNLKQLDDILNYISSNNNTISAHQIYFFEESPGQFRKTTDPNEKYNLSYEFLQKEGFISKDNINGSYRMDYKGLLNLGPNSFVNTYKRDKRKNSINTFFWLATPTAAFIGLILSVLQICDVL